MFLRMNLNFEICHPLLLVSRPGMFWLQEKKNSFLVTNSEQILTLEKTTLTLKCVARTTKDHEKNECN